MSIEPFIEHHIKSLQGSSLLKAGQKCKSVSENSDNVFMNDEHNKEKINYVIQEDINAVEIDKCTLCTSGSLPSINEAHKCTICKTPVHVIPSCSSHIPGDETLRICKNCTKFRNVDINENNAMETWNRKTKKNP
ncbi:TTF-type domain-containing protein [Aphis craccivora]|uniref:TTF-type domain-containing protein n=1 Tax=Aphis craccivora TaxID=307492 RepID=A0A6G0VTP7_APHCR|nr:TTF-type domain-containing protein [Aphis craccivora]